MDKGYGILIVSVTILVLSFVGTASATNWSVDGSGGADFTGIQEAINNASDGDTIIVHSGVYYENVVVNRSVTLMGNGQPVVDAGGGGNAITVSADGITLQGFNATNSGECNFAGIKVTSNNNTISGNNVCNNSGNGIRLDYSSNNIITDNNASNNGDGICLDYSSNNIITGNNVSNNGDGIELGHSSNNSITGNNVNNNGDGISLHYSSNNIITGNTVSNNNVSIYFYYFSNNTIYLNNMISNTDNIGNSPLSNIIWHSPSEMTYTYDGTIYESYLGNYWDGYEGTDADGDGIGDSPHSIDYAGSDEYPFIDYTGSDEYPLMQPFEYYNISTSAYT